MAKPDLFGQEVQSTVQSGKEVNDAYRKVLEDKYDQTKDNADLSFAEREEARKTIEYNKMQSLDQAKDVLGEAKMKEEMLILELNVDAMSSPEAGGLDSSEFKDGHEDFSVFSDLSIDQTLKTDTASMLARTFRQIAYDRGGSKELFAKLTKLVEGENAKVPSYKQANDVVKILWKRLQYLGFAIKRNESGVIESMKEEVPTIKDFLRALMTFQGFIQTPAKSIRENFTPSKVDGVVGPLTLEQLIWMAKPISLAQEIKETPLPVQNTSDLNLEKINSEPISVEPIIDVQTPVIDQTMPTPTLPENISTPTVSFDVTTYFANNSKEGWPTMKEGSPTETRVLKTITDYVSSKNLAVEDAERLTDRLMKTAGKLEKDANAANGTWASYTEDLLETGIVDSLGNDELYQQIEKEFVRNVKKSREANKKRNEQATKPTISMIKNDKRRDKVQSPTGINALIACSGNGPTIGNKFGSAGNKNKFKAVSMSDFYEKVEDAVEILQRAEADPEYIKKAKENLKHAEQKNNAESDTEE